jgi:triphosphoribosyl-dephospho-CoA synthetase
MKSLGTADLRAVEVRLARQARLAMTAEVDLSPKPGLVDRIDNGAHSDMDRDLFHRSAAAIHPLFEEMARLTPLKAPAEAVLPAIRPSGLKAEEAMYSATNRINTHKGQIFSLGVCLAAALRCLHSDPDPRTLGGRVLLEAGRICSGITIELKAGACLQETHGERLYRRKGTLGIRGEAESGFASVRLGSLPRMKRLEALGMSREEAALESLISLYATVEDSTVLHRRGEEGLKRLRGEASSFLASGGMRNPAAGVMLENMNHLFIRENISPGGCADLIALTLFIRDLERGPGEDS